MNNIDFVNSFGGTDKIISLFNEDNLIKRSLVRYCFESADLDDVRAGLARVNSRGKIKWILVNKIKPVSLRNRVKAGLFAAPLRRRLNYSEVARNLIVIQPLEGGGETNIWNIMKIHRDNLK